MERIVHKPGDVPHHIILEGPDGSGKTTLARSLEALGYDYQHQGPPPSGTEAFVHYTKLLCSASKPTVFDRFHLGELVYGPLLRGKSGLHPSDVLRITSLIQEMQVAIVFCYPPWAVCLENTRRKEELIKDNMVMNMAYKLWGEIIKHYPTNVQHYDYTQDRFHLARWERPRV